MDSCHLRRLTRADVPQVHAVETQSFSAPWSLSSLYTEMGDNDCAVYLGAFDGARLMGYIGMWVIVDEAHITNLAVAPAYRQQGVGRALLSALMAVAREAGCVSMTLEVRESNEVAQHLYRSCGFATAGRRKRYYTDNREDALIMWCEDLHCGDVTNRV